MSENTDKAKKKANSSRKINHEEIIFRKSSLGKIGVSLPAVDVPERPLDEILPTKYLRTELPLPELSEPEVVRHFSRLSRLNFSIDSGFYPLGSCTMKYNPRINEAVSRLPGFTSAHPMLPPDLAQGGLQILWELESYLKDICGFDAVTMQPAAGAQGELTGMLLIRAYLNDIGQQERNEVLVPDSAHGTNPASCALCGFKPIQLPSNKRGLIDVEKLKKKLGPKTAAIMLTNPNTLGLFEEEILEICQQVHNAGAQVYMDGANLNALIGKVKPGEMGIDVMHLNLHKTFSTPHGGGGPGSGPVAVKAHLEPFLPLPVIKKNDGQFLPDYQRPKSIGRVMAFHGNFAVLLRAYAYIRMLGAEGLAQISENAVLNANYIKEKLREVYHLPYEQTCMHECVFSQRHLKKFGVTTMDLAKRLMEYGFHPPTVFFPLIVDGAIMIEPTETESRQTLDAFIEAMRKIATEAQTKKKKLQQAPKQLDFRRFDEVKAAKELVLNFQNETEPM